MVSRSNKKVSVLWLLGAAILFCMLRFLLSQQNTIFINITSSMPRGFYKKINKQGISRGDIVAVCLPKKISQTGLTRHYLTPGKCTSGAIAVVKKVIAIPGDDVFLTNKAITVNGKYYAAPFQLIDHNGFSLQRFVTPGEHLHITHYWLLGSADTVHSWDSRYYGGVPRAAIINTYRYISLNKELRLNSIIGIMKLNINAIIDPITKASKRKNPIKYCKNNKLHNTLGCPPSPEFSFAKFFVTSLSQHQQVECLDTEVMNRLGGQERVL